MIATDGKTSRRATQKQDGKTVMHRVSAFEARQRIVLGQVKVAEQSNEMVPAAAGILHPIPRGIDLIGGYLSGRACG